MTKQSDSSSSEEENEEEEKRDEEKCETDDEPEAPAERQFEEEQTRAEILKRMQESLVPPGETMHNLLWTPSTTASPSDSSDAR
jgi:hypothetical protein